MSLVLFDLDDTLLSADTERAWAEHMLTLSLDIEESFLDKLDLYTHQYRKGELDINVYTSFLLKPITGLHKDELKKPIEEFCKETYIKYEDKVTRSLLDDHVQDTCLLVSGTLSFLVEEMSSIMQLEHSFGTEAELVKGVFTGKRTGAPNFSEQKVLNVKRWLSSQQDQFDQIYAYSDSIYDLPMLEFADNPVAVCPDQRLRNIALERNWKIIDR